MREIKWIHCCPEAVKLAKSGDYERVLTTYRDPEQVALSWAKRRFPFKTKVWRAQWLSYIDILPYAEVIPVSGLNARLNSDLRAPCCVPPREDIEFALNLTAEAQRVKFVETYSL
jgi:hypothetical protein